VKIYQILLSFLFWPLLAQAAQPIDPNQLKNQTFPKFLQISLTDQRARLIENNNVIWESIASTGREDKKTEPGIYKITGKHEKWVSTIYKVSMPYFQRFSYSPMGIHAGPLPGYPGSAGCIRLPLKKAEELFAMTQEGLPVVIYGRAKPFEYYKAKARAAKREKFSPYSRRNTPF